MELWTCKWQNASRRRLQWAGCFEKGGRGLWNSDIFRCHRFWFPGQTVDQLWRLCFSRSLWRGIFEGKIVRFFCRMSSLLSYKSALCSETCYCSLLKEEKCQAKSRGVLRGRQHVCACVQLCWGDSFKPKVPSYPWPNWKDCCHFLYTESLSFKLETFAVNRKVLCLSRISPCYRLKWNVPCAVMHQNVKTAFSTLSVEY